MLVEVRDAVFGYGDRPVVRVDRLALHAGRCLGIFGPNGAGKTTLVRGVTGLIPPLAGAVHHQPGLRFGYMPQHRAMELHWPMTALDAAAMALSARRWMGWMGPSTARVLDSMRALGVHPLAGRPFAKLSGGQQQRILLAGALASEPNVLVLDEPTDGLDVQSRETLLDLLQDFTKKGLCTAIISHEVEDLLQICHEIAWLHAGAQEGEPSTVEAIQPGELAQRMLKARRT
jgi:ABC-type Mn2+/Zn2+ transport system ATPase subunit